MIADFVIENDTLKQKLEKSYFNQVYKDNAILKLELKNVKPLLIIIILY